MKELVMEVMSAVVIALATGAFCFIAKEGVKYINQVIMQTEEKMKMYKRDEAAHLFEIARKTINSIIYDSVEVMEHLRAKDLRAKVKAGLADRNELKALSSEVFKAVSEGVSPNLESAFKTYIKDLDGYIKMQIESSLLDIKRGIVDIEQIEK